MEKDNLQKQFRSDRFFCPAVFHENHQGIPNELKAIQQERAELLFCQQEVVVQRVSDYVCPANAVAMQLNLSPDDPVRYFRRLIYYRGFPVACDMYWLPDIHAKKELDVSLEKEVVGFVINHFSTSQYVRYQTMLVKHARQMDIEEDTLVLCLETLIGRSSAAIQLGRTFINPATGYASMLSGEELSAF